ncbi:MAG: hypothetical protein M1820_007167 [Bogoriella megaspora]|nr:MAG: hypothetical protein M1820_007167 [Bogoriella megaspora]
MAEHAVAGALYGVEKVAEGAILLAKGIYDPTLPLKASFSRITGAPIPRLSHSITVIKGNAYVFGGESAPGTGASNDVQVVALPTSNVQESIDQSSIPAKAAKDGGDTPAERVDHTAVSLDDCFFVFGGRSNSSSTEPLDEGGRVWMFNTKSRDWTWLEPNPASPKPPPRYSHAATLSPQPEPDLPPADHDTAPHLPPDPEDVLPEPLVPDSRGTIIVCSGRSLAGTLLNDCWAFDIRSRTWSPLPPPQDDPAYACHSSSLALVGNRLYSCFGRTNQEDMLHMRTLDLELNSPLSPPSSKEEASPNLSPRSILSAAASDWQDVSSKSPSTSPSPRSGASLLPVTTGQGRTYLLAIGGHSTSSSPSAASPLNASGTEFAAPEILPHGDVFVYQLPSEGVSASGAKDTIRNALGASSGEGKWAEVKYLDGEGNQIQEGQEGGGIGKRTGIAAARASELDGGTVVVWGGLSEHGEVFGDGWLVSVEN